MAVFPVLFWLNLVIFIQSFLVLLLLFLHFFGFSAFLLLSPVFRCFFVVKPASRLHSLTSRQTVAPPFPEKRKQPPSTTKPVAENTASPRILDSSFWTTHGANMKKTFKVMLALFLHFSRRCTRFFCPRIYPQACPQFVTTLKNRCPLSVYPEINFWLSTPP